MNMNYPFKAALVLAAFCASGVLFAQTEQRTVTVQECVSLALQNNPDIRVLLEDENKTIADYKAAQGADSLKADLNIMPRAAHNKSLVTVDTQTSGNYYYCPYLNIQATYPLYNPVTKMRVELARKNIDAAKLQGKKGRDDFVANVKTLYFALIRQHQIVQLRQQMKKNYEARLASIKVYVQRGDRPVMDQSSAEVALSQVVIDLKAAQNLEADIMSDLKIAMGLANDSPDIAVTDFPELPELTIGLDQIEGMINNYCSDVQIAANRTEQAKLAISAARVQHLPVALLSGLFQYANADVDLQRSRSYANMSKEKSWDRSMYFGAQVTINLWSGGRIAAQTDSAVADYNKAIYNQRKQSMNARKNAQTYVRRLKELKEQVKVVKLNIANSKMNLTLTQRSFDSGIVNQLVVQNAEMGLLQAQMSLNDAQFEYFKTLASLSNLIGLEESFLCGTN